MSDRSRIQNIIATCLENAPLGLVTWEADADSIRVIDWHAASAEIFGWNKEEVLGRNIFDFLIPESDRPNVENVVRLLKESSFPQNNINDNLTKDGRRITVSWHNAPVLIEGRFTVLSFAKDITDERAARNDLEEAYELTKMLYQKNAALLSAASVVLANNGFRDTAREILDKCSEIIGSTSGYIALLKDGGTDTEVLLIKADGMECTVDQSLQMPLRGLREVAYRTRSPLYDNDFMNSEWRELLPEGHVALVNVMFAPLIVSDHPAGLLVLANKPGGFTAGDMETVQGFASFASISLVNSRNLDRIAESEALLSQLLTYSSTAIYGVDVDGICIFCNPACLQAFGFDDEKELVGKNIHDLVHHTTPDGHELPVVECDILNSIQAGEAAYGSEKVLWRKDGTPITVECTRYTATTILPERWSRSTTLRRRS